MIVFERSGQRVSDFVVREPNMITNLIFSLFNEFEDMIRKHQIQQIHLNHNYESYIMINQYEDKCLTVGYFIWNFSKRQHFTP